MAEVEFQLRELREIVDRWWEMGEIEKATLGEGVITSIGLNTDAVVNMIDKFIQWMRQ